MPDDKTPAPSPQGQASTRDAIVSLIVAAAAGAAVVVFQGVQSGQYPLTLEGFKSALAAFGVTFAGMIAKAIYSGPVPSPEKI